jgi:hypothetical protein
MMKGCFFSRDRLRIVLLVNLLVKKLCFHFSSWMLYSSPHRSFTHEVGRNTVKG